MDINQLEFENVQLKNAILKLIEEYKQKTGYYPLVSVKIHSEPTSFGDYYDGVDITVITEIR